MTTNRHLIYIHEDLYIHAFDCMQNVRLSLCQSKRGTCHDVLLLLAMIRIDKDMVHDNPRAQSSGGFLK